MSYLRYEEEEENADSYREEHLKQSRENLTFVYEQRKKLLGEEHPYTLLTILHLARLKSAVGQHKEAETMIREGLKVAERNVGKEHIAILMAKTIYAEVLTKLGRFAEAESIFYMLIDKARYSQLADEDGEHPDRLSNLWLLAQCLEEQGKFAEALEMYEELLAGLGAIGGQGFGMRHKILPRLQENIARLQETVRETESKAKAGERGCLYVHTEDATKRNATAPPVQSTSSVSA
jgi:tetratricopeptide (TPR) repeat protein